MQSHTQPLQGHEEARATIMALRTANTRRKRQAAGRKGQAVLRWRRSREKLSALALSAEAMAEAQAQAERERVLAASASRQAAFWAMPADGRARAVAMSHTAALREDAEREGRCPSRSTDMSVIDRLFDHPPVQVGPRPDGRTAGERRHAIATLLLDAQARMRVMDEGCGEPEPKVESRLVWRRADEIPYLHGWYLGPAGQLRKPDTAEGKEKECAAPRYNARTEAQKEAERRRIEARRRWARASLRTGV